LCCIKDYLKDELITGIDSSKIEDLCPSCEASTNGTKKLDLYTTPEVLVISFKRFKICPDTYQIRKLCNAIQFPQELNLCEAVTGPNKGQSTYSIYAVSNHIGNSFQSGHYSTHCRDPKNDSWFVLNDSIVNLCSNPDNEIFSSSNKEAYILFYKRVVKQ